MSKPDPFTVIRHDQWDGDDAPGEYQCDLGREPIGWITTTQEDTYGSESHGYEWRTYWTVQRQEDAAPTRFCEDCFGWLQDAASAIMKDGVS